MRKCVDSVLNQDYPIHEIICVDDCSTDGTSDILKSYGEKIKVYTLKENQGLGIVRVLGIAKATGDYIYCIDSDDWIDADAISYLAQADGDIITGGEEAPTCGGLQALIHYGETKVTFMNNRLIKKSLFDLAPHSTMRYLEDLDTLPRLFANCEKAVFLPDVKYHYNRENPSSLSNTSSDVKRYIYLELGYLHTLQYLMKSHPDWIVPSSYVLKVLSGLMVIYQSAVTHPDEFNLYDEQTDEIVHLLKILLSQVQ